MEPFTILKACAAPMMKNNIDTDQIIPKQYLSTIERSGLGDGLFSDQRYLGNGSENPDFILNRDAFRAAQIIVAGGNFGCGSSREHAPWALHDFGIRCIIAPSFAVIFYNNCFNNGILPAIVDDSDIMNIDHQADGREFVVDLSDQIITLPDGHAVTFSIDSSRKKKLLCGLDDVSVTLGQEETIGKFEARREPWM